MNRGACRQNTFRDPDDRNMFLEILARSVSATGVEIHAYCLMGNHFHLLVRTPRPRLDNLMQRLGSRYTREFNIRHGRDGALFRGRYRAALIESEHYLLGVSRYIHRNPLEIGVDHPADYLWSSYPSFVGIRRAPGWLSTASTIELAGSVADYRALVESPLTSAVDTLYQQRRPPTSIGSAEFMREYPSPQPISPAHARDEAA